MASKDGTVKGLDMVVISSSGHGLMSPARGGVIGSRTGPPARQHRLLTGAERDLMLQCSINSGAQDCSASAKRSHPWISSLPGVCGGDDGKRSEATERRTLGPAVFKADVGYFWGDGSAAWT